MAAFTQQYAVKFYSCVFVTWQLIPLVAEPHAIISQYFLSIRLFTYVLLGSSLGRL